MLNRDFRPNQRADRDLSSPTPTLEGYVAFDAYVAVMFVPPAADSATTESTLANVVSVCSSFQTTTSCFCGRSAFSLRRPVTIIDILGKSACRSRSLTPFFVPVANCAG